MRAADTDRIAVVQLLTDAAAQGRLEMSEFEDRLKKAYAAQTFDELDRLSSDLPGIATTAPSIAPGQPAPSTLLLAIMSGFERRGRWNVPKRLTSVALFGGGVIDLRYADFTAADVEIHSYSIFGGQTILLPPELNVVVGASASWVRSTTRRRGLPRRTARHHSRVLAVGQRRDQAQEAQGPVVASAPPTRA